jgi:hypothetical protein
LLVTFRNLLTIGRPDGRALSYRGPLDRLSALFRFSYGFGTALAEVAVDRSGRKPHKGKGM